MRSTHTCIFYCIAATSQAIFHLTIWEMSSSPSRYVAPIRRSPSPPVTPTAPFSPAPAWRAIADSAILRGALDGLVMRLKRREVTGSFGTAVAALELLLLVTRQIKLTNVGELSMWAC